jgi:hypothetical protein
MISEPIPTTKQSHPIVGQGLLHHFLAAYGQKSWLGVVQESSVSCDA